MTDAARPGQPIGEEVVAPPPSGGLNEHQRDSDSFTVRPVSEGGPSDGGGSLPYTGGAGDTTHPEAWAHELSLTALQDRVRAAGLDPGDRTQEELVTLLKQYKPSNRTDPRRHAGPGADGGTG